MKIQIELNSIAEFMQLDSVREALIAAQVQTKAEAKKAMTEGDWTPGGGSVDDSLPQEEKQAAPPLKPITPIVPTTAPHYTHDDLAKAAITLMDKGKQPELLELLREFGVQAIPMLSGGSIRQFAVRLREMGADI